MEDACTSLELDTIRFKDECLESSAKHVADVEKYLIKQ